MTACTHFQVVELGEEGSRFKATLRANNTEIQYKFTEQQRGLSGGAECSPLIKRYHLLFTPHRYLAGILCEENETNTRELLYPFKLQALFFFFYSPPMSSRLPLELFVSILSCSQRRPQTSHTCFSHQMSRRRRNWRHFRVCLAICPPKLMVKGHSESMSERKGLRLTGTCRDTRIERKLRGRNDGMIVS